MSPGYELLPHGESAAEREEDSKPTRMGLEEQFVKSEDRAGDRLALYVGLGSSGITLLATWALVLGNNPTNFGWFAFHPPLQTLAIFLLTYGIMTLQPTSQPKTKAAGFQRHQFAILFLALPSFTLGTLAIVYNKYLKGSDHFKSWHGKFGLLCMIWMAVQVALGGGSVWYNGAAFGGGMKAKAVWKYHRLSGYGLFPLLLLTVNLGGAWSHWGEKYASYGLRFLVYVIAPAAALTAVFSRTRLSKMKFF